MRKILFLLLMICFISCSFNPSEEKNINETVIAEETTEENENPNESESIIEDDEDENNESINEETDTSSEIIEEPIETVEDTTEEIIETFSVIFYDSEGNKLDIQTINKGSTVSKPTNPTKTDYKFKGWYKNGKLFDFNTPINETTELVACFSNNVSTCSWDVKWGNRNTNRYSNIPIKVSIINDENDNGAYSSTFIADNVFINDETIEIEVNINNDYYRNNIPYKFKFYITQHLDNPQLPKKFDLVINAEKEDNNYCTDYSFDSEFTWCGRNNEYGIDLNIKIYLDK